MTANQGIQPSTDEKEVVAMRCRACGAEAVQQAIFCQQCGERLEATEPEFPPASGDGGAEKPQSPPANAAPPPANRPASVAERVQHGAAANGGHEEPEEELWRGGFSPKGMLGSWAASTVVTVAIVVAWIVWQPSGLLKWLPPLAIAALWISQGATLFLRRTTIRYRFTTQRLIIESGLLRRQINPMQNIEIDDLTVEQGVFDRFGGTGKIIIVSSDRTNPNLVMEGIENVRQVADLIDKTRRNERRRRGLYVEQM
jgi:hypothetical protein